MSGFDDPEEIRKAKELAAGPLGDQLAKFPLRFATSAFIAPSRRSLPFKSKNGTVTLLRLKGNPLGVTCSHVLDGFRSQPASDKPAFWIGRVQIDPIARLVSEDNSLDIAVLDLSGLDLSQISGGSGIGVDFFDPSRWPPELPKSGDFVSFGGFPGTWRDHPKVDEVVFRSFSVGASEVTVARDDYIVCQFNREYWVSAYGNNMFDFYELGGMSGGPAFIWRGLQPEFFGIIKEYSPSLDLLYISSVRAIKEDGSINL
ncbi:MAG TPA: hypothetical protein VF746_31410 [Longimicrobium sp.]|jgi:hypothetical protein